MHRLILVRSLLYQAVLVGSVVVFSLPLVILGPVVSDRTMHRVARTWARLNLAALRLICNLDVRVTGFERLPTSTSVVLCNHQSTWETIALRALLPLEQSWVLKKELTRIPLFGSGLRRLQSIAIDRSAGRRAIVELLREGQRSLDAGRWVIVFPEGTRVAPGDRRPYALGGASLAERSGRPVVPIAHNAGLFWGRRSLRKQPGTVDLIIGPAIGSVGRGAAEINEAAKQWIEATVAQLPSDPRRASVA